MNSTRFGYSPDEVVGSGRSDRPSGAAWQPLLIDLERLLGE